MNLTPKSRLVSLALTTFFGPLGLIYSSITGALILIVVAVMSSETLIGPIVCWVLAVGIGDYCTQEFNKNIEDKKLLLSQK